MRPVHSLDFLEPCYQSCLQTGQYILTEYTSVSFILCHISLPFMPKTKTLPSTFLQAAALFTLIVVIGINLAVGLLPHVDNFAHIGGFLTGFFLGFILLPRPQFGWAESRLQPTGNRVLSKHKAYQYVYFVIALVLLVIG